MPVTIKDIAAKAGVSHPTVSRALRNDTQVSKATCRRIQALARKMGYQPNPALSALIAYRHTVKPAYRFEKLAILCPSTQEAALPGYIQEQLAGIRARSRQLGYSPEIHAASASEKDQLRLGRILYSRGIRGVIVTSLGWPLSAFEWKKFCCVGIGENAFSLGLNYVSYDHAESIRATYAQLRRRGYRNIGYLNSADSEERNRHLFLGAYLQCRHLDGLRPAPPCLYPKTDFSGILPWLRKHRFDALIAINADTLQILLPSEYRIPDTLGFACCGTPTVTARTTGFACYVDDGAKSGSTAVDFLQVLIHKSQYGIPRPENRYSMLLQGQWRDGDTVRAPVM